MGAGGGVLGDHEKFWIEIEFTDAVSGQGHPLRLDPSVSPYTDFVAAIQGLLSTLPNGVQCSWQPGAVDGQGKIGRGRVELHGPIAPLDERRRFSRRLNRVLRGMRVYDDLTATGLAARVRKNIGPAAESNMTPTGPSSGPDFSDMDWSPSP